MMKQLARLREHKFRFLLPSLILPLALLAPRGKQAAESGGPTLESTSKQAGSSTLRDESAPAGASLPDETKMAVAPRADSALHSGLPRINHTNKKSGDVKKETPRNARGRPSDSTGNTSSWVDTTAHVIPQVDLSGVSKTFTSQEAAPARKENASKPKRDQSKGNLQQKRKVVLTLQEMTRNCTRATLLGTPPPNYCSCDVGEFGEMECKPSKFAQTESSELPQNPVY